ncbi:hypothetical protein CFC21_083320 [Triticum aestivum]|uniref:Uncharacterized protein n=2 Tax=Triticum aestivum TaxID=4565 RepID=A0A9R1I8E6_WHEAT|nr:hypothetical protein CFC21_083320 [Triticum aestivum]
MPVENNKCVEHARVTGSDPGYRVPMRRWHGNGEHARKTLGMVQTRAFHTTHHMHSFMDGHLEVTPSRTSYMEVEAAMSADELKEATPRLLQQNDGEAEKGTAGSGGGSKVAMQRRSSEAGTWGPAGGTRPGTGRAAEELGRRTGGRATRP